MATISLSFPTAGTIVAAGLHATNYGTIQTLANGGIDNNNFAAGRIFDNTKIMQGGALDKQALVWNNGATQWQPAYPPGFEYAYTEFTSTVNPVATTEATANTVVTASAVTFDGSTVVMVEFFSPMAASPSGQQMAFALYDGAASVGEIGRLAVLTTTSVNEAPVRLARRLTPSAAAHTYSLRAYVTSGTGTVDAGAGGAGVKVPGYIRITKV